MLRFRKSPAPRPDPAQFELLNLGCGGRRHPAWLNVDLAAAPGVYPHDLQQPLPFSPGSFRAVYHSHVLEHLPHARAAAFIQECFHLLRPGGILRVAVPDLETIARLYLQNLEGALAGAAGAEARYDWITLELLDQMVRERSGGEMGAYWRQRPMPAEEFVFERVGSEAKAARERPQRAPSPPPRELKDFRATGEVHRWMYDRFSLGRLLTQAGFAEVRVCAATDSAIPGFATYELDVAADGSVHKPDSLFVEGTQPDGGHERTQHVE